MQPTNNGSHPDTQDLVLPLAAAAAAPSITELDFQNCHHLPGDREVCLPEPASKHYLERQQERESNARSYPHGD